MIKDIDAFIEKLKDEELTKADVIEIVEDELSDYYDENLIARPFLEMFKMRYYIIDKETNVQTVKPKVVDVVDMILRKWNRACEDARMAEED